MFRQKSGYRAWWILVAITLVAAFVLIGCRPAPTAAPPETEAPTATEAAPAGEPTEVPAPAAEYKPVVRQAKERYLIGYIEGLGEIEFSARMRTGMEEVAEEMGVDLLVCDSKYEAEAAINCAQLMADRGVDGVVNSNWYAPAAEAMSEILTEAGIPHVASDVEHPNAVFFGVDNCDTGHMSGNWLADYALNVWKAPPEEVWVVMGENPDVGEEPEKRISCSEDTIRERIPDIPEDHFVRILGGSFTDEMLENMTTWLTAHPDAKYILTATINDQGGAGAAAACEAAGRVENCAVVGQDGIQMAYAEFEKPDSESAFKASVGHFPELYGQQMLPMVVDLIEGNPVPDYVRTFIDVIDRSNLDKYPLGGIPEGWGEEAAEVEYVPVIRPAEKRWKIGYGNGLAALDFSARVTKSIYDTAEKMGVDVVECDNAYDQEATFNCADLLISQDVDGIIFANWLAPIAETVGQKWVDAGIPAVTYDGPHPGAVDFGADNYTAGFVAGEYLGNYVKEQGWDPQEVWLVLGINPDVGEGPNQRLSGCQDGVQSVIDMPDDHVGEVLANQVETAYSYGLMTDWLTGHPQAQYVLACSINDQAATGFSGGCEGAGKTDTCAVVGQGVDAPALVELHERTDEESAFKGSVAYWPDRYGEYLVPIIVDVLEGKPVPDTVRVDHAVIDRSNVNQFYPAEEAEEAGYVPQIRPAKGSWKIGYGNGLASDPFSVAVTENVYDVAEQMGVTIVECDNAYDPQKTFECADLLIAQEVDGIIFANWHADIAPAVGQKWIDAGIPAVTYDGPHPGAVDFGADNYSAGFAGGEYLGNYIVDKGWSPDDVWVALVYDPEVGEGPNQRVDGCRDGIESVVDIPDDQFGEILGGSFADSAFTAMTDWLTAHPDAGYVVGCSIDDPRATGMSGALEAGGWVGRSAIVGQGVTAEAFAEFRRPVEESAFIASVAYTPELYGNYLVPIIVDLIEGNPVPDRVALDHFAIDRDNLDEWYPQE